jgi:biopolymer transport protein TolR
MGMAVGGKKGVMADMNIVPLIDILLVLLIIFMVVTPTTPHGLEALVPQPTPPEIHVQQPNVIVVHVMADGKVRVNQEGATWDDLGPRLADIFKIRAEKVAFVKGDENVQFLDVAHAIDIMRGAGIERIGLIGAI